MTVTYSEDIETSRSLTLLKLLFCRWRGSLFKLLWRDLLVYLSIYFAIHFIYLYGLEDKNQRHQFEELVVFFRDYKDFIPLSLVLGFFVSTVMTRWWNQYMNIPWPYTIAVYVSSTLQGYDEVGRAMRRTIMRYVCLSLTMVFRVLSTRVKGRFPKMSDLVDAGLLMESELAIIEALDQKFPKFGKNWLPIVWAASLVNRAREEGRIRDDFAAKTIIEELSKFRGRCGILLNYNTVCIPLVYTQVVTIAVHSYLLIILIAMQNIQKEGNRSFMWQDVPFLSTLQFLFYMGWLKVAETMLNPFGDDDDDFEVNIMIDRNIQMSYLIVDEMHQEHPELLKDQYWNEIPTSLPDRTPEDKKKEEKDEPTDIFDVKSSVVRRKTTFNVDIESPSDADGKSFQKKTSSFDKIPRAEVIAKSYQNVPDVEAAQSIIESQMELHKQKRRLTKTGSFGDFYKVDFDKLDDDESVELTTPQRILKSKSRSSMLSPIAEKRKEESSRPKVKKDSKDSISGSDEKEEKKEKSNESMRDSKDNDQQR